MLLKFIFFKKATRIEEIFPVNLTVTTYCQIDVEDYVNFCGLLRIRELSKNNIIHLGLGYDFRGIGRDYILNKKNGILFSIFLLFDEPNSQQLFSENGLIFIYVYILHMYLVSSLSSLGTFLFSGLAQAFNIFRRSPLRGTNVFVIDPQALTAVDTNIYELSGV